MKAYFRVKADTIPAHLEILKTKDDGNVSGISFTQEESVPGIGYCRIGTYTTDSGGKISVPNLTVGTKYRVTETVPEGYEAEVQSQEITLQPGANTLTFVNHRLLALEIHKTSDDGEVAGISFTVEQLVPGIAVHSGSFSVPFADDPARGSDPKRHRQHGRFHR